MKTETSTQGTTTHSTTFRVEQSSTTYSIKHDKVILITGGGDYDRSTAHSAEIFLPNSPETKCILPDLPADYVFHTQDGGMICGGRKNTENTCRQWNSTEAKFPNKTVHSFEPGRYHHVSWSPVSGKETFLIGGMTRGSSRWNTFTGNTSTLVKPGLYNGTPGFNLTYLKFYRLLDACAIPDPDTDTVVITGGQYSMNNTFLYNQKGFLRNLGDLNYVRVGHGCTSYISDNRRVCFLNFMLNSLFC